VLEHVLLLHLDSLISRLALRSNLNKAGLLLGKLSTSSRVVQLDNEMH
jgi:hypothetical protein